MAKSFTVTFLPQAPEGVETPLLTAINRLYQSFLEFYEDLQQLHRKADELLARVGG